MVSTFDLVKRIEEHVLAIRRAPYYAAVRGRQGIVIAERALALVVAGECGDEVATTLAIHVKTCHAKSPMHSPYERDGHLSCGDNRSGGDKWYCKETPTHDS